MANRNLSELPLNDNPQETDWLLGASGASPAVFQKIPVGAIQIPGLNDLTTIENGQSIKWDSTLQKFVFFCLVLAVESDRFLSLI